MSASRHGGHLLPGDIDFRIEIAVPYPCARGTDRIHNLSLENRRKRLFDDAKNRERCPIDSPVVVFPERSAGVPSGSIPLLVMVLAMVNVPVEGIAIILGVDRILDMCRTVLNVTGDITCAAYIARLEGIELKS